MKPVLFAIAAIAVLAGVYFFAINRNSGTACYGISDASALKVADDAYTHQPQRNQRADELAALGKAAFGGYQISRNPATRGSGFYIVHIKYNKPNGGHLIGSVYEDCVVKWSID
jgi:hypothetical protein